MIRPVFVTLLLLAAMLGVLYTHDATRAGATLEVNSNADTTDLACDPISAGHSCTLRDALHVANQNDQITFNIATGCGGNGVCTITLGSDLPTITATNILIDGYSQPGATQNTQDIGNDAAIKIGIDANGHSGFVSSGIATVIQGLSIYNVGGGAISLSALNGQLYGNYIGVRPNGNWGDNDSNSIGVVVNGGLGAQIGGLGAADHNLISGFDIGIVVQSTPSVYIEGNYIGTGPAGGSALPNRIGVHVSNSSTTHIGGGSSVAARNVISGNTGQGILIDDNSTDATVLNNYIGVKANGSAVLANGLGGVVLDDAHSTLIGDAGQGNIISGNPVGGVQVLNESSNIYIQGNRIGTSPDGTAAYPNGDAGVLVDGSHLVTIGGLSASLGNLISGNAGAGITVREQAFDVSIQGNYVGTNPAGTSALPNLSGLNIDARDVTIGGGQNSARNIISGNTHQGIFLHEFAEDAIVQRNYIGTTASGTGDLGNGDEGIIALGQNTLIQLNVIAGNGEDGLIGEAPELVVQGNIIGGPGAPNSGNGITIGDDVTGEIDPVPSGPPNIISNNGGDGIEVSGGAPYAAITISRNSIFANGGLGIDLVGVNGVNSIDNDDVDTGPNGLQNAPTLTGAHQGSTHVSVTVNAAPTRGLRLELFNVVNCDGSGTGEGTVYLGSLTFTTDATGDKSFDTEMPATAAVGSFITATLTDLPTGSTSEFSNCIPVAAAPTPGPTPLTPTPTPIAVITPPPSAPVTDAPTPTPSPTPTATPTLAPTPTGIETETGGATPTATPTGEPTITPTPSPTPTGSPDLTQGDVDCDGHVTGRDALVLVGNSVGINVPQFPPCPGLQDRAPMFGDVNCDGAVDIYDGASVLKWLAELDPGQELGCVAIGDPLTS